MKSNSMTWRGWVCLCLIGMALVADIDVLLVHGRTVWVALIIAAVLLPWSIYTLISSQ